MKQENIHIRNIFVLAVEYCKLHKQIVRLGSSSSELKQISKLSSSASHPNPSHLNQET